MALFGYPRSLDPSNISQDVGDRGETYCNKLLEILNSNIIRSVHKVSIDTGDKLPTTTANNYPFRLWEGTTEIDHLLKKTIDLVLDDIAKQNPVRK